jgi:hypothetical protein
MANLQGRTDTFVADRRGVATFLNELAYAPRRRATR